MLRNKLGCFQDKIPRSSDQSDIQTDNDVKTTNQNLLKRPSDTNFIASTNKNSISPLNSTSDNPNEKMLNPNNLLLPKSDAKLSVAGADRPSELGRKKMTLGKGYSLMDWIRYSKTTPNISGNNGIMRQITYEELALHNKQDDCWMSIFDKVYNVTPYMKFHPGGVEELMKGAGLNATDLFNDVHPWVNFQSMLEKCLIGSLVGKPAKSDSSSLDSLKLNSKKSESKSLIKATAPGEPVIDSYQTLDKVNIVIYTKWKNMHSDYLIIDKINSNTNQDSFTFILHVYIKDLVYKFSTELQSKISENYKIKVSQEGKVELILLKSEHIQWKNMSPSLNFTLEKIDNPQTCYNFRECELLEIKKVNYDTDIYTFNLLSDTRMHVPIGYHVFLKFYQSPDDYPIKPYTVIDNSLFQEEKIIQDGRKICLMIKHYKDGYFTSKLRNLKVGSKMEISNFAGNFKPEKLTHCNELVLICAGSGLTPMIRLLINSVKIDSIKKIILLFFNKKTKDILWLKEIEKFQIKYADRIIIKNVLSQPDDEWTGLRGRIREDLVNDLIIKEVTKPLCCICGPKPFTDLSLELLKKNGYTKEFVHAFIC